MVLVELELDCSFNGGGPKYIKQYLLCEKVIPRVKSTCELENILDTSVFDARYISI